MIKKNTTMFKKGDIVVLFRRKSNGYPKRIKDGEEFIVYDRSEDFVLIYKIGDSPGNHIKIHKTFLANKQILREIKLEEILNK